MRTSAPHWASEKAPGDWQPWAAVSRISSRFHGAVAPHEACGHLNSGWIHPWVKGKISYMNTDAEELLLIEQHQLHASARVSHCQLRTQDRRLLALAHQLGQG